MMKALAMGLNQRYGSTLLCLLQCHIAAVVLPSVSLLDSYLHTPRLSIRLPALCTSFRNVHSLTIDILSSTMYIFSKSEFLCSNSYVALREFNSVAVIRPVDAVPSCYNRYDRWLVGSMAEEPSPTRPFNMSSNSDRVRALC